VKNKLKAAPKNTAPNNGIVAAGLQPFAQIAKVSCGKAFVSVHLRPVSTPSLSSVGHNSQVLGTQAQYKLATSQCLNVRCNIFWRKAGTRTSARKNEYGVMKFHHTKKEQ